MKNENDKNHQPEKSQNEDPKIDYVPGIIVIVLTIIIIMFS